MKQKLQDKINELIARYDPINNRNLRKTGHNSQNTRDYRLPIPGSTIHKEYKGQKYTILVLKAGFEYQQRRYKSLTAIAKEITGTHWNGYNFFGFKK